MIIAGSVQFVAHQPGGDRHKIKKNLVFRKKPGILKKRGRVETKVIMVFRHQFLEALDIARGGKSRSRKTGINMRDGRVADDQARHRFFDDIIDPGGGKKITKGLDRPLHHDRVADVDVRDDQYSPHPSEALDDLGVFSKDRPHQKTVAQHRQNDGVQKPGAEAGKPIS